MQPDTVMTLRVTSRPFQALGKCSPTSKWDPLFAQLTPSRTASRDLRPQARASSSAKPVSRARKDAA